MTLSEFLRLIRRRWYVLLVALLCAALFATIQYRTSGVYSTRTIVYLIHHNSNPQGAWPSVGSTDETLVSFAGTIVNEVNRGRPGVRYASEDAPLYGVGLRQGVRVTQSNSGGQWWSSFPRAEIEVQIVGPGRAWVAAQQQQILSRIVELCRSAQGAAWADPDQRITPLVAPLTDSIDHITPARLDLVVAAGAILGAALICGGWAAVLLDRRARRGAVVPGQTPGTVKSGGSEGKA
ncbi:hypothetical protein [Propionibacterium cyclohexanicum]|uniref:hypothetical protein n=1 Tax=Propionibacterium cyclohexanicum TaxID=64702 RepID=UPI0015A6CBFC|nr:hypothetical protein [Propionibacterium cyclohexanicum]